MCIEHLIYSRHTAVIIQKYILKFHITLMEARRYCDCQLKSHVMYLENTLDSSQSLLILILVNQLFWRFFFFLCLIMKNSLERRQNLVLAYLFQETLHHTGHLQQQRDPPRSVSACNPHWFAWMLVLPQLDTRIYTSQGAALWNWWHRLESLGLI